MGTVGTPGTVFQISSLFVPTRLEDWEQSGNDQYEMACEAIAIAINRHR